VPSSEAVRRALEPSAEELYEDAPCGYLSMLQDGTLAKVNRTLLRSMGYAPEELLGRRLHDLLAPGSRIYHETHWGPRLALEGEVREVPVDLVRADGTRLTALLNAVLTRTAEGHPSVIRASVFDATDRRRYERELVASRDVERDARRQSERLLAVLKTRSALQSAVVGLSTRALEGIALADLLEEATATVREALGAGHVSVVTDGSAHPEVPDGPATLDVPIGPPSRSCGRLQVARAARRPFSEGEADFLDAVGTVLANAMERRRIEDATRHLALHDALTGLPNRTKLDADLRAQIQVARAAGSAFALCLLDLDDFKLVNDTFGHAAGDTLLQAVGDRLRESVRPMDTVARLGGDEFVVLAGDVTSAGGPQALAERLIACLERPFVIHGATYSVRTSMGVVSGGADSRAADVLRDADIAMYEAKARGPRPARAVRCVDARPPARAHPHRGRAARSPARGPPARLLPARRAQRGRPPRRLRGARPLGASRPRPDPAGRVHPRRRGLRPHRRRRELRARRGLPAARRLA
jgi:diguanylate cyclase (GGDEF)-like protein/PAS domain S-box-containing protein